MMQQEKLCLKQALQAMDRREIQAFEKLDDPIPPFSEQFERRMEKLLRAKQNRAWQFPETPKRRLLSVVFAIILISVLTVSAAAIGKAVFPFIVSFWKDAVGLEMAQAEHRTEISEHYTLGEIPENFVFQEELLYEYLHITKWIYGDQYISLKQGTTEKVSIHVSLQEGNHQYITLRGVEMLCVKSHGYYDFIWSEDGYSFTLICPADLPWDDIVRMIESIRPVT